MSKTFTKEDLIKELESGKYRQGQYQLYYPKDDSYCCLGVMCIMCGYTKDAITGQADLENYPDVVKAFGLSSVRGRGNNMDTISYLMGKYSLAEINDNDDGHHHFKDVIFELKTNGDRYMRPHGEKS